MTRLTLDDVRDALPELDDLRPIFDHLLATSVVDDTKQWSGSGRLDTIGTRLVPRETLMQEIEVVAAREANRLRELYPLVGRALAAVESGDRNGAARALLEAAGHEERRDRPDRAEAYAAAAFKLARGERDQRTAALALRRWGRASRAKGDLSDAHRRYAEARDLALAMSDVRGAAEAAIGAGNVLEEQGRWSEAAAWYRSALAALESLEGEAPERWHALLNLHIVARSSGAIEDSVALLDDAVRAAAPIDPEGAAPLIDNARGQLDMARGEYGAAERHFRKALQGDSNTRARVSFRLNLAEALLAQSRTLDAAELAREAERDAVRAGLVPKLPEVYRLLGRIASADGDADAFVLFERALELVRERRLPALEEALTLQAYAEAEAERGDEETARQLYRDAAALFQAMDIAHMRRTWADVFGPDGDGGALTEREDDS